MVACKLGSARMLTPLNRLLFSTRHVCLESSAAEQKVSSFAHNTPRSTSPPPAAAAADDGVAGLLLPLPPSSTGLPSSLTTSSCTANVPALSARLAAAATLLWNEPGTTRNQLPGAVSLIVNGDDAGIDAITVSLLASNTVTTDSHVTTWFPHLLCASTGVHLPLESSSAPAFGGATVP